MNFVGVQQHNQEGAKSLQSALGYLGYRCKDLGSSLGSSYCTEGRSGSGTTCFAWRRKFTDTQCWPLTQFPAYSEPCWLHGLPALQEVLEKCLNSSYSGSSCCKEAHFTQKIPYMLWKVMQTAQI